MEMTGMVAIARVTHDVGQGFFQSTDSVRLSDHPRVQGNGHDSAVIAARFTVKPIELVNQLVPEVVFGVVVLNQNGVIVNVDRMRHGHQLACAGVHGIRHVVIDPVANIVKTGFFEQVKRVVRL
jgi:hypothetical protein